MSDRYDRKREWDNGSIKTMISKKIPVKEATAIIEESLHPLKPVSLRLSQALGCRLAADLIAVSDYPPFARSPLDGYALKRADIAHASKLSPAVLRVVGQSYAGAPSPARVSSGEAVYILTGGAIPAGADCVIRQENTDLGTREVRVFMQLTGKDNISPIGEDFKKGDILALKGEIIHASTIAVATASGYSCVSVIPGIKAGILATGDEIVVPGRALAYGQIYDSNSPYLAARLSELNITTEKQAYCPDQIEVTKELLRQLLESADVIFTTGGVSVGERDLVPEAIRQIGGEILFHGVAMKPGMPTLCATVNGKPILSLSGNPYSAAVAFELFGRAILASLSGNDDLRPLARECVLANDFAQTGSTFRYLHGVVKDGFVALTKAQGNAQMRSFASSNCLVEVSPQRAQLKRGDTVQVYIIR